MKLLVSSILVLVLISATLATPATNVDEQLSPEVLAGIASARKATARFHRVEQAEAEGYINLNFCEEGEGCHWLNPSLLDGEFDPAKPEILLYLQDGDGWRLVGVEYVIPLSLSPGVTPEGFPGVADTWREDSEGVGLWELTAWIWLNNPNGMFEQHNPRAE